LLSTLDADFFADVFVFPRLDLAGLAGLFMPVLVVE
jgi:hypothetical protein